MKTAIKVGLVLGMILIVCSWTAGVAAQERIRHERTPLQELLGLSDAQVTAIRAEQEAAGTRIHQLREQVQMMEEQVYQAAEETGDATTVGKLVLQKIALQKQIRAEEAGLWDRINSIFTPAQQDKLEQLKEADQLSRGWDALLGGERRMKHEGAIEVEEGQMRHEGVPGGGGAPTRPHRERPPQK